MKNDPLELKMETRILFFALVACTFFGVFVGFGSESPRSGAMAFSITACLVFCWRIIYEFVK